MSKVTGMLQEAGKVFEIMLGIGLFGILFMVVFGNLSGNLGFAANSQGANDTNSVINNLTGGARTFFSFSGVWFTLLAVTILIVIILSVISFVKTKDSKSGGFSN